MQVWIFMTISCRGFCFHFGATDSLASDPFHPPSVEYLCEEKHEGCFSYGAPLPLHLWFFWSIWPAKTVEKSLVCAFRRVMFMVTHTVHCVVLCQRWSLVFFTSLKTKVSGGSWSTYHWHFDTWVVWKQLSISHPLFPVVSERIWAPNRSAH